MDAAGGSMGQRVGNAAAVTDDVQTGIAGFQLLVDLHFHVVELNLHAIQQGIIIGSAGGNLVQRIDHFDNAVQNSLGQHQAQVAGGGVQSRGDECLRHAAGGRAAAPDQIAEPLDDDTAAQHIA